MRIIPASVGGDDALPAGRPQRSPCCSRRWPPAAAAAPTRLTARPSRPRRPSSATSPARSPARAPTVRQILEPSSDPHAYEPRPSDVKAVGSASVVLRSGGDLDAWLGDVLRNAGSDARTATILDEPPVAPPRPTTGSTRTGGRTRATPSPRCARSATCSSRPTPPAGRRTRPTPRATSARVGALDRAIARCMRAIPASRAQARHRPRRARLLRRPLRHRGRRHGDPGELDAGSGVGGRGRPARAHDPLRGRVDDLPRELGEPEAHARDRSRGGRAGRSPRCTPTRWARRARRGRPYLGSLRANTLALAAGFTDGRARCALPV